MKRLVFTVAAALAVVVGAWFFVGPSSSSSVPDGVLEQGDDVPAFEVATLEGERISSEEFEGKILVLDFWATWCGPCLVAFPKLENVYARYAEDPDVLFLAVNTGDDTMEKAQEFAQENPYLFPFVYDIDGTLTPQMVTLGIPTLVIIDQEGRLVHRQTGYSPSSYETALATIIDDLRAEDSPA
ncbi:MAG: TlpA disulfide reductase family protein [Bacteroidota bacterium]